MYTDIESPRPMAADKVPTDNTERGNSLTDDTDLGLKKTNSHVHDTLKV